MAEAPSQRDAVGVLGGGQRNGGDLGPITPFGEECECERLQTNLEPTWFVVVSIDQLLVLVAVLAVLVRHDAPVALHEYVDSIPFEIVSITWSRR